MSDARERMLRALDGLSVGDAFGDQFFGPADDVVRWMVARALPDGPWKWTDDTAMALALVEVIERHGGIDQDALASVLARRFLSDRHRKYGPGAYGLLTSISEGADWRSASKNMFGGMGSFGNGAAMRVAPLGAYFAGDLGRVVREATLSSEVTHGHPEGIAGGIAIAVAAALAVRGPSMGREWMTAVLEHTPRGKVHDEIRKAIELPDETRLTDAAVALGNGSGVSAPDTVPLCLWIASRETDFEHAMWKTVSALGDRDTTCAIVGGILAARGAKIPSEWLSHREPLDR